MRRRLGFLLAAGAACLLVAGPAAASDGVNAGRRAEAAEILPMRERAEIRDALLKARLDDVVPRVMRGENVDMWVLIAREYNEDPVVETMLPATWLSARRRTILVFTDSGETVERFAVSRYPVGDAFPAAWDPEAEPDQWRRLAALVAEHDPRRIAVNYSATFSHADGVSYTQHRDFMAALDPKYRDRVVSGEGLAVNWLETRTPAEMALYPGIVRLAHDLIAEAFSRAVITPGETTTDDVAWWLRQKLVDMGLKTWFQPSVSVQRAEKAVDPKWPAAKAGAEVIRPGDLVHVDFGVSYLGLNTDTQQHAYVLTPGETAAPAGLQAGLAAVNRAADHLTAAFEAGRTSNQILARAREAALADGLRPSYYSHGIGAHGHGAGSPIGWWDDQSTDHPMGFRPLRADTAWSIELNVTEAVADWGGQDVIFKAEEDAFFDGATVRYLDGRQTGFHLIPSDSAASSP